jgi:tetratricopeptide (TPR) repeat protein
MGSPSQFVQARVFLFTAVLAFAASLGFAQDEFPVLPEPPAPADEPAADASDARGEMPLEEDVSEEEEMKAPGTDGAVAADEPANPFGEFPAAPAADPSAPVADPSVPAADGKMPAAPADDPANPFGEFPAAPAADPNAPVADPSAPAADGKMPAAPADDPASPFGEFPAAPAADPSAPAADGEMPAAPADDPANPAAEPAQPDAVEPPPVADPTPQPVPVQPMPPPPAAVQPKLLNQDAVTPAPAAAAQPAAADTTVSELQQRIAELEKQLLDLSRVSAGSLTVQQQLSDLRVAHQELDRRLQAVEKLLNAQTGRSDGTGALESSRSSESELSAEMSSESTACGTVADGCSVQSRCMCAPSCHVVPRYVFAPHGWRRHSRWAMAPRAWAWYAEPTYYTCPAPNPCATQPNNRTAPASTTPSRPQQTEPVATEQHQQVSLSAPQHDPAGVAAIPVRTSTPVPPPPIDLTGKGRKDAERYYGEGFHLYFQRQYGEALRHFEAAATLSNGDARYFYFRGLSELALDDHAAADRSFDHAARIEYSGNRQTLQVAVALERIQGPARRILEKHRTAQQ